MRVRHDGGVWTVVQETDIDGDPAFQLWRPGYLDIVARKSDCKVIKPRTRRIKGAKIVLESYADGSLKVRRCKSSRRYPVTLDAIYDLAVRLQVFKSGRVPKALRARGRR